jgi:hypothetical protein
MSRIAPGDLVETIHNTPNDGHFWYWQKGLGPGMQGVALTGPYVLDCRNFCGYPIVRVRFAHTSDTVIECCLRKISPPPLDDVAEVLTDEQLTQLAEKIMAAEI